MKRFQPIIMFQFICEEISADNYVSIFNSHDFFVQINCSNLNHLLLVLFIKQGWLQKRVQYQTSMNIFFLQKHITVKIC